MSYNYITIKRFGSTTKTTQNRDTNVPEGSGSQVIRWMIRVAGGTIYPRWCHPTATGRLITACLAHRISSQGAEISQQTIIRNQ